MNLRLIEKRLKRKITVFKYAKGDKLNKTVLIEKDNVPDEKKQIKDILKKFFEKIKSRLKKDLLKLKKLNFDKRKFFKFKLKQFFIIPLILLALVAIFSGYKIIKGISDKNKIVTVKIVELKTFESKGSRDENKVERSEFAQNTPIQAMFKFSKAKKGTVIKFALYNSKREEKQVVEIPLENEGLRFVSLTTAGFVLEKGNYEIEISQGKYILKKVSFSVI